MNPRFLVAAPLLAGSLLGAALNSSFSRTKSPPRLPPSPSKNPNIVVLRSTKRVTLKEPKIRLTGLMKAFSKQTGYTFTLDDAYRASDTTYAFLFTNTTLNQALDVTGYLTSGRWERKGSSYHLRPARPEEDPEDLTRLEANLVRINNYLNNVDSDDPSLSPEARKQLRRFWGSMDRRYALEFPVLPDETMADCKITTAPNRYGVRYDAI